MPSFNCGRLEDYIDSVWRGRENDKCLWWQGEWWSWGRFAALAGGCAEKLRAAGFTEGQRLAMLLPNSPLSLALMLACWRLGGAIAPLNARTGAVNLSDTIKMLDVHSLILTEDGERKAREAGFAAEIPLVPAPLEGPLPEWKGRAGTPEPKELAVIFSTSGTSGLPKAVGCTHANLIGDLEPISEHVPSLVSKDGVMLNVLPNFHAFGFTVAGLLPLCYGMAQAVVPSFVPVENTIKAIKESGVNRVIAVPTVMAFLIGALAKRGERLSVEYIICGGDRLNVQMEGRCREYLGVGILEGYGLTECSPVVAVNPSEEKKKLGTVGPAFANYEIEIRDREENKIGLHDEGVLYLKGPAVVSGYFRDEENTRERFTPDGWFNTGDVVRIDEDGYITIVDRATDIIIVSGFNVYPQEVEAALCKHPAVHAAVAVGEKNNVAGELVKAFVILNDGAQATAKELMEYCRDHLAHYKVPRKIGFVKEFPISPTGKILRRELRKTKIEKEG